MEIRRIDRDPSHSHYFGVADILSIEFLSGNESPRRFVAIPKNEELGTLAQLVIEEFNGTLVGIEKIG